MKNWLARFSSLRFRLTGAMLLMTMVPLVMSVLIYLLSTRALELTTLDMANRVLSDRLRTLDDYVRDINLTLQDHVDMAEMLDYLLPMSSLRTYSPSSAQTNLTHRLDNLILNRRRSIDSLCIVPIDENRQMIYKRSLTARVQPIYRYEDYEVVARTLSSMLPVWTCDLSGDAPFLCASLRVYSAQRDLPLGVMMIMLNTDAFQAIVGGEGDDGAVLLLSDADKSPIYATGGQAAPQGRDESLLSEQDGKQYLRVSAVSQVSGWHLSCLIPYARITHRMEMVPWLIALSIPLILLAAVLSGALVYRWVYRPINQLSRAMSAFTMSTELSIQPQDELAELQTGFAHMKRRIAALIESERAQSERRKRQEIHALQMQIMPHFLFNTLNSIKSLVALGKNRAAEEMLVNYTGLLRVTIGDAREFVPLNEELNYLRQYVLIMSMRQDEPISLQIDADERFLDCPVPKYILQPLAENSILHGFTQPAPDGGHRIRVGVRARGERLVLTVEDNGGGIDAETLDHIRRGLGSRRQFTGIGIHNIDARVRLLYGDEFGLVIENQGGGVRATLEIPIRPASA